MVTAQPTATRANPYRSLFQQMLSTTLEHLHQCTLADAFVITDELRAKILHNLSYALALSELWLTSRTLLLAVLPLMRRDLLRNEWVPYLEAALARSEDEQDPATAAVLTCQLGALCQWRSDYSQAQRYLQRSVAFARAANDPVAQTQALNRAAYVAYLQHDLARATDLVDKALALVAPDDLACEFSYFVQGMMASIQHDTVRAIILFRRSIVLANQIGDAHLLAMRTNALGTALCDAKQYEAAIDTYHHVIELFEVAEDRIEQALTYMNLGNVYLLLDQPADALPYYRLAEGPIRQICDEHSLAQLEHNLGLVFRELQRWELAKEHLHSAIQRWLKLGNTYFLVNSLDDLGLLYFEEGQLVQARQAWQKALDYLKAVDNMTNFKQVQQSIQDRLSGIALVHDGVNREPSGCGSK